MRRLLTIILILYSAGALSKPRYTLSYPIPNGWRLAYHIVKGKNDLKEFIPVEESLQRWTRMLTVQEFSGIPKEVTPEQYLRKFFTLAEPYCATFRSRLYPVSAEVDFPTGLGLQYCGTYRMTRLGEVTLVKVIHHEVIYVVQLAWRGPPFGRHEDPISKKEMNDWRSFMENVRLVNIEDEQKIKVLHSNIKL